MNKTTTIRDLNKMLVRGELPEELNFTSNPKSSIDFD